MSRRTMLRNLYIIACLIYAVGGQLMLLQEHEYAVDISYQTVPGDDPILYFTIRTYVPRSSQYHLTYNISGFFNNEHYYNAGDASHSSSENRPQAEYTWYHEHQDDEIRPGNTILYWVKVEAGGQWYQSVSHEAIVGQEAPTSLKNRQAALTPVATPTSPSASATNIAPAPAPTPSPPAVRSPPLPSPTPTPSRLSTPAPRSQTPSPSAKVSTSTLPPTTTRLPATGARRPQNFAPVSMDMPSNTRDPLQSTSADQIQDVLACLQEYNYLSTEECYMQYIRNSVQPVVPTVSRATVRRITTDFPVSSTESKNTTGITEQQSTTTIPTSAQPGEANGGDSSGQQLDPAPPSQGGMDMTIVIIATVVPAVVMFGLIVMVTIIVKHRRARVEPDPYQQVIHNMNYNSTMEIGRRPGLPPPRESFKKPTEETEYEPTDSPGDIYEAITHVDYELNGNFIKPRPPSVSFSQKSTTMTAKTATDWGSDEYEDPDSPNRASLKNRPNSMSTFGTPNSRPVSTIMPNATYGMYHNPSGNQRATLATATVANSVYSDSYQDPALRHGQTLPVTMAAAPQHIYSETYQDPTQSAPTFLPASSAIDPPQQLYEVPDDANCPTRQYSALCRDESGLTLH
ncbi:uncharacterized protein [Watersipora subatra]|uniref:uncharacterized protein isoform X1 n=1 Tax=Watersipora subatra TaxID=2589382 RepID=UPI00355B223B